jgi:serine/threonine protein kinase
MEEYRGQHVGNYKINRLLGQGVTSQVYLGEHLYLQRSVAVKVLKKPLDEEQIEQFCREAETISRLVHPNIVRVLDFGVEERKPYLVMEYAPHGTLRQLHLPGTIVPLSTIARYVQHIAAALDYAHQQKVLHRDVKPENLLLGPNQEVLLSDFGIAVAAHHTYSMSTQDGEGEPTYMAPEQLLRRARPASDQYALGVVVYEWLCGAPPFQGLPIEVGMQHLQVQPPPLLQDGKPLSPAVAGVVLRALEKDRHLRFASVQAFADAFSAAIQQDSASNAEGAPPTPPSAPPGRQGVAGWARRRFRRGE